MLFLKDKFKNTRIILASKSPRRSILLDQLGIGFETYTECQTEELYPSGLNEHQIPVYLAEDKSAACDHLLNEDTLLITADTIVWCEKRVLDKPAGREEAISILEEISGRTHQVITGVCLRSPAKSVSFSSSTSVSFRKLRTDEILYYVDNFEPYDKAGAYGIQEWIGYIGVESINGSYFNVMGLPLDKVYENLMVF